VATPKVFISSTCFDLSEVREQLQRFVRSFGFEPILSEHGDVFYHPDLHTHEACVHEVSNCQLFILIIGGRFGGSYNLDKSKSITNAEYEAARTANVPVFTYVRNGVLNNHHIFRENRSQEFVNKISYPAIDKQADAENIFNFIDNVRRAPTNNAFEGFDNFNEIESHLRKQWAGMFFEFLKTREIKTQIDATNHLLNNLKGSSSKLEDLVKSLYLSTTNDSSEAEKSISNIEILSNVRSFFRGISDVTETLHVSNNNKSDAIHISKISKVTPARLSWDNYLVKTGLFLRDEEGNIDFHTKVIGFIIDNEAGNHKELRDFYDNGILQSSEKQRLEVLLEFVD
jgi:hypothetical protein